MNAGRRLVAGGVIAALAGTIVTAGGAFADTTAPSPAAAVSPDRTSAAESREVDAVPTPVPAWSACFEIAECATVRLPLDYDQPRGATTEVAVLRVKAKDQANKIGSLFVNPGGPSIPVTKAEKQAYIKGSEQYGRACSTTGKPLSGAMSTAEVARDHEVLRRAVGDRKLTYLGLSYGSVLGQYYANMFPGRFRALVVDGVLDARSWVVNTRQILDERINSSGGSARALTEILRPCDKAGETACVFAAGDPVRNFDTITRKLKAKPLVLEGVTLTYADFVLAVFDGLNLPTAGEEATTLAAEIWAALDGDSTALLQRLEAAATIGPDGNAPYDNHVDSAFAILCTDGLFPAEAARWPAAVAAREKAAPHFGSALARNDSACAGSTWTVRDEDAYTGPFDRRTAAPVLVVGSFWDPATNYAGAVSTSRLLPNSRLLSSDNWGHTAYGSRNPIIDAKANAEKYGMKVAHEAAYPLSTEDFAPVIDAVAESGSDVFVAVFLSGRLDRSGAGASFS
ncbi:alpha/beta fold hydrolase [Nonomuraea sp. NPDC052116]|uniref:alpha/beta fold hydrolase n=1 Tax=Nonomuraea sp. NPDC052116 TaxID=3155665 RepID=UPI0034283ADB